MGRSTEVCEFGGRLGKKWVAVKLWFSDGVLYDVVVDISTASWRDDSWVHCMGVSKVVDKCFNTALTEASRLLRRIKVVVDRCVALKG